MDRREQILAAAREVVAEGGIAALSVRSVAARAELGASTLRHYYPSQRALYDAVVADTLHAQLSDLRIADTSADGLDRLAECVGQFLPTDDDAVLALPGWFALYATALGPEQNEQGRRLLGSLGASGRARVTGWLVALGTEGLLRPGDPADHAVLVLALVDGLCLQLLTPGADLDAARARELLRAGLTAVVDA